MSNEGFGEEHIGEGELREVESDGETVRFSASDKRIKEIRIDRLSQLPDSILIHILSFLGVKSAGIASLLSKRWEFLWAELPSLEFWENNETKKRLDFVSWVNRTIGVRKGNYLEKFLVKFLNYNECFNSDVDAWVEFSVKNEVKQFNLMTSAVGRANYYKLPQVMYSCPSLTSLHLMDCIMSFDGTIEWRSLTSMTLFDVMLDQRLLDEILSGCPALKSLHLEFCWGFNRLEVNSRCLHYLIVEADVPFLEISAPYLCSLDIKVFPQGRKWQLRNISSVDRAYVGFFEFDGGITVEEMGNAREFLEHFKHVNDLHVHNLLFKVLSTAVVNGWQLPQLKLRHLSTLCWSEYEHTVSGIISLLESSPNLETLHLEGYDKEDEIAILDPNAKNDLDGDLLHLKKIRINSFADPNGEPLLTLAPILLRRAPALEEMVIDVADTSDFVYIAQTLLTYPRSSTKAQIYLFRQK